MPDGNLVPRVEAAIAAREGIEFGDTTAWRLFDGRGDGVDGVFIDQFDGHWLVQTQDRGFPVALKRRPDLGWRSLWWKRLEREDRDPPAWMAGEAVDAPFLVRENGLAFEIDFAAGYSQGLFLDQRLNRARVRGMAGPGEAVLNLFAYTCGFSVAAAAGGAVTTSLDLAQACLEWGKRNLAHNGIDPGAHHFCRGDALEWLERWRRSGRRFGAVVADPPTFSRAGRGRVFRVERDFGELVRRSLAVVAAGGWAVFTTNCRAFPPGAFRDAVERGAEASDGPAVVSVEFPAMPPEYSGEPYLKSALVRTGA